MKKLLFSLIIGLFIVSISIGAFAMPILEGTKVNPITWIANETDSDGVTRAARAQLMQTGANSFAIDLFNDAPYTHVPNQVLVGLFFDYAAGTLINPDVSSNTLIPSTEYPLIYGNNLNGEWAFRNDVNDINDGRGQYGILASSFDPLAFSTPIDPTVAYIPPPAPAGADFGIVNGYIGELVPSKFAYVYHHAHIEFDIIQGYFDPNSIRQLHFAYGTDYSDTPPVPEPGTLLLLGTGLMGVAAFGRKKLKK